MRLRSRLLLLVLSVLVPAVIGAAVGIAYVYREQKQFNHDTLRQTSRALSQVLDQELRERERVLHALAASPALAAGDLKAFHAHVQAVGQQRQVSIILSDTQGRQLLNSRLPFGTPLPSMTRQERDFRARMGNELTLVSNLYEPPKGLGPLSFAVQIPVRGPSGQVERFLMLGSVARQLQGLLGAQPLPAGWLATVTDREGYLVARNTDDHRYVGQRVRPELLARLPEGEGFHEGVSLSGLQGTGFFSRAPFSGWYFIVTVPTAQLQGPAVRATAVIAGLSLLLLALAAAAAVTLGRRIARPMEALRADAQALGRNEPVQARMSGIDEMDAVHAAMSEASERLRQANADMERKVAEAVGSYEKSQRALVQAQKLEALGRLTGGIAHDFNNVLQTLTTGLQAARMDAPEKSRRLLAACERAVARGSELARQLMVFGRVQEVRVETIALERRLADARPLLTGALPSNVVFEMALQAQLWPVAVDPLQLELALLNLVMNARDAMPAGGRVLLVEDDPLVRETVRTGLEACGFEVRTASTADEALKALQDGPAVDVVFTDVVMPGALSGLDLARLVGERHPQLRVVIATGYSDRAVDVPGVRALAKPYDLQQAVQALNEALQHA